jgi:hypothetical protein
MNDEESQTGEYMSSARHAFGDAEKPFGFLVHFQSKYRHKKRISSLAKMSQSQSGGAIDENNRM